MAASSQVPEPIPVIHWAEMLPLAKVDQLAVSGGRMGKSGHQVREGSVGPQERCSVVRDVDNVARFTA